MDFAVGLFEHEPFGRLPTLFPNSYSISAAGGINKWRHRAGALDILFDAESGEEGLVKKGNFLGKVKDNHFCATAHLPWFRLDSAGVPRELLWREGGGEFHWSFDFIEPHLQLFAERGVVDLTLRVARSGNFLNIHEERLFLAHLPRLLGLIKSRGLKLSVRLGGLRLKILGDLLASHPELGVHLDLEEARDGKFEVAAFLDLYHSRIQMLTLCQMASGGRDFFPLAHKGFYNMHEIFGLLLRRTLPPFVFIKSHPELKNINFLMENLAPEGFDRIFSKK